MALVAKYSDRSLVRPELRWLSLRLVPVVLSVVMSTAISAQESEVSDVSSVSVGTGEKVGSLSETFNVELTHTQLQNEYELSFDPHYWDTIDRDYVRVSVGMRYGITDRWEVRSRVGGFVGNRLEGQTDSSFSELIVGTKYRWNRGLPVSWESAVGIDVRFPIGNPPSDLSDDVVHVRPFFAVTRKLGGAHELEFFGNISYDMSLSSIDLRDPIAGEFLEDFISVTPGLTFPVDSLRLTFQATLASSELNGGDETNLWLASSVLWTLPKAIQEKLPGRWDIGLGIQYGLLDAEDNWQIAPLFRWNSSFDF